MEKKNSADINWLWVAMITEDCHLLSKLHSYHLNKGANERYKGATRPKLRGHESPQGQTEEFSSDT